MDVTAGTPIARRRINPAPLAAAVTALAVGGCGPKPLPAPPPDPFTDAGRPWEPGATWHQYADPREAGWDSAGLAAARDFAGSIGSAAVLVVHRGRVVVAWGDVARRLPAYSVRKTLLGALYGVHWGDGDVDLDETLGELGITELTPLTPSERSATVRNLLGSRSGVFLPAAYATGAQDEYRPERGAAPPGKAFFYNNWDFNVLGTILRQKTGADLFADFARRVAAPLQMEDFRVEDGGWVLEPTRSLHPAYTFRISARDLARVGLLYLRQGRWGATRVLPSEWVDMSWTSDRIFSTGWGYGFLWHVGGPATIGPDHPASLLNRYPRYLAAGTGGQLMMVIPDLDLVLVSRGDTENDRLALRPDHDRAVRDIDVLDLFAYLVSAKVGRADPDARLVDLDPAPLAGVRPQPPRPARVAIPPSELAEYPGRYQGADGLDATVFVHEGRLFVSDPRLGETELFRTADGTFVVTDAPRLRFAFTRAGDGRVAALVATELDVSLRAERVGG